MKNRGLLLLILTMILLLCACSAEDTFETLQDAYGQQQIPVQRMMQLSIPEGEQVKVLQNGDKMLYLCDAYEITTEILPAGDLSETMHTLSGFGADDLTVIETGFTDAAKYEWVWTAAGETGEVIGRAVVLDDGCYHYCMTVMANAKDAGALADVWQQLLATFRLA